MICVDYTCDNCKHKHEGKIDGWKNSCDAFPDGIPSKFICYEEPKNLPECNSGIGFEPREGSADE